MSLGIVKRLPKPLRRLTIIGANRLRELLEQRTGQPYTDPQSLRLLGRMPKRTGLTYVGTRVAVAGLFGTRCGLQRGAELMARDLEARGIEVLRFDFNPGLGILANLETIGVSDPALLANWRPTDVVIHLNPPLFARALALLPTAVMAEATLVGFWVWELSAVPAAWGDCADNVDEIWTPSPFVADAIAAGLPTFVKPVRVVPHPVDRDPMRPTSITGREALRKRYNLALESFVIGTSFSFDSNYARKNPCATIDAFRMAFHADERVVLIIRCNDCRAHRRLFDHLTSYVGADPRIHIWDSARVTCPIQEFYGQLDMYISLHRSEGYGLNMVEAAQAGLPVLATGWGLAPDIANRPEVRTVSSRLVVPIDTQKVYEAYPGTVWAEPDRWEAMTYLHDAYASWLANAFEPTGSAVQG